MCGPLATGQLVASDVRTLSVKQGLRCRRENQVPGPTPATLGYVPEGLPPAHCCCFRSPGRAHSPMDESQSPSSPDGGVRRSEHGEQVPPPAPPGWRRSPSGKEGQSPHGNWKAPFPHPRPLLLVSFSSGRYLELLRFSQVQRQENKSNVQL